MFQQMTLFDTEAARAQQPPRAAREPSQIEWSHSRRDLFERFLRGASHPDSLIEKTVRLKDRHFNLRGQIDLAYPEDERQVVLDWKIGAADGESSDSFQLLSYALAAVEELDCAPESIDLYKVHLGDGDGKVTAYTVRDHQIRSARARIIQDTDGPVPGLRRGCRCLSKELTMNSRTGRPKR